MTAYRFTVELSEQELWSVEGALESYILSNATQLRIDNPELVIYASEDHIQKILNSNKLNSQPVVTSTSSLVMTRDAKFLSSK